MTGMGRRKRRNALEQDAFSRYWRQFLLFKPGERKAAKQAVHKRERLEGKREAKSAD